MSDDAADLPFLLGVPREADRFPQGLRDRLAHGEGPLRSHADVAAAALFELGFAARVQAKVHPYACDLTRAPDDRSDAGVVPRVDLDGAPLYPEGEAPSPAEVEALVEAYHGPYHQELAEARSDSDLLFHFQVLGVEAVPPPEAPDRARFDADEDYRRPQICLGNLGGPDGGPSEKGFTSCDRVDLLRLARLFEARGFTVGVNDPFPGGHDVEVHGRRWYAGIEGVPVALLAVNHELYLSHTRGIFDPDKAGPLKASLKAVLDEFAAYLGGGEMALG